MDNLVSVLGLGLQGLCFTFCPPALLGSALPAKIQRGGASSPLPTPWSLVPLLMLSPCDLMSEDVCD